MPLRRKMRAVKLMSMAATLIARARPSVVPRVAASRRLASMRSMRKSTPPAVVGVSDLGARGLEIRREGGGGREGAAGGGAPGAGVEGGGPGVGGAGEAGSGEVWTGTTLSTRLPKTM